MKFFVRRGPRPEPVQGAVRQGATVAVLPANPLRAFVYCVITSPAVIFASGEARQARRLPPSRSAAHVRKLSSHVGREQLAA